VKYEILLLHSECYQQFSTLIHGNNIRTRIAASGETAVKDKIVQPVNKGNTYIYCVQCRNDGSRNETKKMQSLYIN
jgi:hypothetical protein